MAMLADRLAVVRRFRHLIAETPYRLARPVQAARGTPFAETLVAEVVPVADACRFLEREAESILAPRHVGRRFRPLWLAGAESEIRREPFGTVLIIAPSNYLLFLPAVQALQAYVAGNRVVLKPGRKGLEVAQEFARLLAEAGMPPEALQVLDETPESARQAIEAGVDKVVLTGSEGTGAAVLAQLAPKIVPATMELSGDDPVLVRADADLELVVSALRFGLRLNDGDTCIAPRRVLAAQTAAGDLQRRLDEQGLRVPVAPVADDEEALRRAEQSTLALGATIFSRDEHAARTLAARLRAGVVVINDMIAPTADPRLPFGGRGKSGFGVTRGREGLLEMTQAKVIILRHGKTRRHFEARRPLDEALFCSYLLAAHGATFGRRAAGAWAVIRNLLRRGL